MTTDTTLLSMAQRLVLEPADGGRSWPSRLWDREEILAYLNDAQTEFVRRTGILKGWILKDYGAGAEQVILDAGVQLLVAASTLQEGVWRPCPPTDRLEADALVPTWNLTPSWPHACILEGTGTATVTLVPIPRANGQLHAIVVPTPQPCTGNGDPLSVGAMWTPFLLAGVLARMHGKPGVVYDAPRAARYQSYFDLGVTLAVRRHQPVSSA